MQHRKFTDIIVYEVEMDALLSYTVTFGDLFVSDMEYCVCKNGSLKKMRDYLDIWIIRSGYARQDTNYPLNTKELAGVFVSENPAFSPENHAIDTAAPSPPDSCLRRERRALSGGMRYMDMPCSYTAGMFCAPMSNRIQIR